MSQESGRTRENECLLQMPGQLHLGIGQDQTSGRSCIKGPGSHVQPSLVEELLTVDGFWGKGKCQFSYRVWPLVGCSYSNGLMSTGAAQVGPRRLFIF